MPVRAIVRVLARQVKNKNYYNYNKGLAIMFYLLIFLIILVVFVASALAYLAYNASLIPPISPINIIEKYENKYDIKFMTFKETADFLRNDSDAYVRNMSALDLHARHAKTYMDYIDNIEDTAITFTAEEKELLGKCADKADNYFKMGQFKELEYANHINGNDIAGIKWIFANTYANQFNHKIKEYEEGLPHTRENIIFVSKNVLKYDELNLTNTLIHEKIHIYQRYNSNIFDKIIKDMGLLEIDKKAYKSAKYIRSNPDTNSKIYYAPANAANAANAANSAMVSDANVMVCLYRNDNPNSINDVIHKNYSMEHPYEKIAYEIAENYYKYNKNKYVDIG